MSRSQMIYRTEPRRFQSQDLHFENEWMLDNCRHRDHRDWCWHLEFGPACVFGDDPEWWLEESRYTFAEWLARSPANQLLKLKLVLEHA